MGGGWGSRDRPRHGRRPATPHHSRRFYGSVEIDMVRPVKAFDAMLNAVVLELQRNPNAKVKITLEIEAETPSGFSEAESALSATMPANSNSRRSRPGSNDLRNAHKGLHDLGSANGITCPLPPEPFIAAAIRAAVRSATARSGSAARWHSLRWFAPACARAPFPP